MRDVGALDQDEANYLFYWITDQMSFHWSGADAELERISPVEAENGAVGPSRRQSGRARHDTLGARVEPEALGSRQHDSARVTIPLPDF